MNTLLAVLYFALSLFGLNVGDHAERHCRYTLIPGVCVVAAPARRVGAEIRVPPCAPPVAPVPSAAAATPSCRPAPRLPQAQE